MNAFITGIAAEIYYERNQLEECLNELEISIGLSPQYQDPSLFIHMYLLKAKIYVQQNQSNIASAILSQVLEDFSEKQWKISIQIMQAISNLINTISDQTNIPILTVIKECSHPK